jgi:hypothetical protein
MCNYRCKTTLFFLFPFYDVSLLFSELRHSTLLDRHGKYKQPLRLIMWRGWPSGTWRRVVWHVGTCGSDETPPQSSWQDRRFLWSVCSCIPVCMSPRYRILRHSVTAFWTSYSYLTYSSVFATYTFHRYRSGFWGLSGLLEALNGSFEALKDVQMVRNRIVNTVLTKAGCYPEPVESVIIFTQGFL